jgi:hypothetical protein
MKDLVSVESLQDSLLDSKLDIFALFLTIQETERNTREYTELSVG